VLTAISVHSLANAIAEPMQNNIGSLPLELVGPTASLNVKEGWRFALGVGIEHEALYHGSGETEV
jgi:hypothetical protein